METNGTRYALIRSSESFRNDRVLGWYAEEVAKRLRDAKNLEDTISTYHVLPESDVPEYMRN